MRHIKLGLDKKKAVVRENVGHLIATKLSQMSLSVLWVSYLPRRIVRLRLIMHLFYASSGCIKLSSSSNV